ncbi:Predicted dithiol-disulfide isomerase, DsbA family [Micromonospora pallida]|uniref:Predicted dithiol-disulfide isomerase, DsbA family n=1 Tax=Micromonospora pallida TaxID=145854 RepID=A0A1C6TA19_9ACTN|nr:DsbA family oxidoreductase [Micromonospora pallida]SCL38650.1 Predicted dithiol-disulfide isomerase, DsbA family [Micromonospora pallida]
MEIEIYADVVCPWCYVGKRRLEQALAAYEGSVTLRYRPFQLDPTPVAEPRPLLEGLGAKFGGVARARQMADHVAGAAAGVGLKLDFDRAVTANTFDAHRLVRFTEAHDRAAEMIEALFQAHFTDGVDIGSRPALASIAATVGLDETEVRDFLDSDAGVAELRAELAEARSVGVTSVPTFVLAGKYAVSGAQEPETLLAALAEVERRESSAG